MTRPVRRSGEGPGDVDLLARLRGGDRAALVALHDRLGGTAFALARRILADDVLAEDVVQDVFLAVWRDPGGYDATRGGVASWVLAAVHQRAVDAVRREQPQRSRGRVGGARPAAAPVPHAHDDAPGGGTDEEHEALVLACYGGYTQREVAALTGVPLDTVRARMLAGVRRLRQGIGGLAGAVPGAPAPADGAGW